MQKREWLTQERKAQGFTLQALAERVGCSFSYLCDLEKGRRTPSGNMALRIAEVLDFDMVKFFERKEEKNLAN